VDKLGSTLMIWLYRLTRGGVGKGWMLLLTTRGRKTGARRTTPLRYVRDGDAYVVVGSNWGKPNMPAWYLNLQADPHAEIQVGARRIPVEAHTVHLEERQRLWDILVQSYPPYDQYLQKTTRILPIVRLTSGL
jgi:deazaflavin-dependent oxidoreductase (nitroreductase family)